MNIISAPRINRRDEVSRNFAWLGNASHECTRFENYFFIILLLLILLQKYHSVFVSDIVSRRLIIADNRFAKDGKN